MKSDHWFTMVLQNRHSRKNYSGSEGATGKIGGFMNREHEMREV
jgi:hypothetical protein